MTPLRIIASSDFHGTLPDIPECDLFLIGGDVCPIYDHSLDRQLKWLDCEFREYLTLAPAKHIVGIAGNHDFVFEKWPEDVERLELPWTYLRDAETTVEGLRIWGIPWVPYLSRWAFYGSDVDLENYYYSIPEGIDIVLSHGPPYKYQDNPIERFGAPQANHMLARVKPKLFICGHVHEGYGHQVHASGAEICNVSHMTREYVPLNDPVEIIL